jgi:hypothetical protein
LRLNKDPITIENLRKFGQDGEYNLEENIYFLEMMGNSYSEAKLIMRE